MQAKTRVVRICLTAACAVDARHVEAQPLLCWPWARGGDYVGPGPFPVLGRCMLRGRGPRYLGRARPVHAPRAASGRGEPRPPPPAPSLPGGRRGCFRDVSATFWPHLRRTTSARSDEVDCLMGGAALTGH